MRWALSRSVVPCFGGPVPQRPNRSSVEGTLLHALIERLARHTMQGESGVFRPRRTLLELVAGWAADNARNPRIDSKVLARQVRIEEILRAFGEVCPHVKIIVKRSASAWPYGRSARVFEGPESWLRDTKSKLCGRADLISYGEIVDFKSGDKQDDHVQQIVFYGALYLAQSRRMPTALRLMYAGNDEVLEVPVPTLNEMESLLEEMRRQAAAADRQVVQREFPARPDRGKCRYCHVRGLCDGYWRSLSNGISGEAADGGVVDYVPTEAATVEAAAIGVYVRDNVLGSPSTLHLPQEVVAKLGASITGIRVLALRANAGGKGLQFALTNASEIYANNCA